MGLSSEQLRAAIDQVAAMDARVRAALERVGYPEARIRARGYSTLLRTIVGQQLSFKAADSIWRKLEAVVGEIDNPATLLAHSDELLRNAGLSRQKIDYARALAGEVVAGRLDFASLPADDEEAIRLLTRIRGIGRWSAEIYLLFAEGRPDIWPAGDLAVQIELGRILGLDSRPSEREARAHAAPWRPHRGAMAVFMWHHYQAAVI